MNEINVATCRRKLFHSYLLIVVVSLVCREARAQFPALAAWQPSLFASANTHNFGSSSTTTTTTTPAPPSAWPAAFDAAHLYNPLAQQAAALPYFMQVYQYQQQLQNQQTTTTPAPTPEPKKNDSFAGAYVGRAPIDLYSLMSMQKVRTPPVDKTSRPRNEQATNKRATKQEGQEEATQIASDLQSRALNT